MSDCIFCKIINKEAPANIVYEDETALAVMDIFPTTKGQVLIISKRHEPYVFDLTDEHYTKLMLVSKQIIKAIDKTFSPVRTCLLVEGFEVDHAHIKLYPCYEKNLSLQLLTDKPTNEEFEQQAQAIKKNL